jgi:hypothetical protein
LKYALSLLIDCVVVATLLIWCMAVPARAQNALAVPPPYHVVASIGASHLDLVTVGRELARERGMAEARDTLEGLVLLQDASRGRFERDLVRAAHGAEHAVPGSIGALPRSAAGGMARKDVVFLFVNGLGQKRESFCTTVLHDAVAHLRTQGFGAEILTTSPYAASEANGEVLLRQLKTALAQEATRDVVIVAVSKGVHDLVQALGASTGHPSHELTADELGKIRYVVSMSGVVRSSVVAGWLLDSNRFVARLARSFMRVPLGDFPHLRGIESLKHDPWEHILSTGGVRGLRCVWLSFVVFPDGVDGQPKTGAFRRRLLRSLQGTSVDVGPYDGLTESASSLLPPGTGLEQWVVRVRGAHGIVHGKYLDGTPVVGKGRARGSAAQQIIDPLLRSLPIGPAAPQTAAR